MTLRPLIKFVGQSRPFTFLQGSKALPAELFAPSNTHPIAIAALAQLGGVNLVIVPSSRQADEVMESLAELASEVEVISLPSWETLPHERLSPSAETIGRRLKALHRMHEIRSGVDHPVVVLISVRAALQPVIGGLEDHPPFTLERGKDYLLPELALKLIELAYERVDMVTRRGEFAIRGGILDVFPTTSEHALRLEFFGDELEDIREFSVADQRSIPSNVNRVEMYAARELLITPSVAQRAREMAAEFPNLREMLEKISNGIPAEGMESLAPVLVPKLGPVTDYLSKSARVILVDPEKLAVRAESLVQTNQEFLHAAWDAAISGSQAPIDLAAGGFYELSQLLDLVSQSKLALTALSTEASLELGLREIPRFTPEELLEWLADQQKSGQSIVVTAQGHGTAERIVEILQQAQLPVILTEALGNPSRDHITVVVGSLSHGFALAEQKLLVLTEGEFFGSASSYVAPSQRKLARRRGQQVDPLALKQGDYVVHEIHGIGRFKELVQRSNGVGKRQHAREYLVIEYAPSKRGYPGDSLFVPTDQLDMLTRYVGGEAPVLSKMGGTDWARAKGNARKAVRKIAVDLVKLYSARMKSKGHAFGPDTPWQHELEEAFTFQETPDQHTTNEEVNRDMEKPIPMDRLLAGDVGYGKTEVAVRAAFKSIQDGKQVVMLVPTTLLVRQHLETFQERYKGFPITEKPLSRFQSASESKETIRGLETGGVD